MTVTHTHTHTHTHSHSHSPSSGTTPQHLGLWTPSHVRDAHPSHLRLRPCSIFILALLGLTARAPSMCPRRHPQACSGEFDALGCYGSLLHHPVFPLLRLHRRRHTPHR